MVKSFLIPSRAVHASICIPVHSSMSSIIQTTVHLSNARKESQISKDENQDQNAGKKNGRKEAKIIQQQGIKVLIKNPNNLFKIVPTYCVSVSSFLLVNFLLAALTYQKLSQRKKPPAINFVPCLCVVCVYIMINDEDCKRRPLKE